MELSLKVFVYLFLLVLKYVSSNETYECGQHGRFEYCVDEIPGCVVGCHCHPGYYFDTDTKICEPNTKLIEHHRRHKGIEPTRIQIPLVTQIPNNEENKPDPIDTEVSEISKDADNLGDWLYNQFFKTIENQVINSTHKDKPFRRSGQGLAIKTPKRSKKVNKNIQPYKKKNKKAKLKKKLMRITEDDSIFQDSSDSDSDTDSGSSSSSGSGEASDSNGHEHKKIVMFQKGAKRPLPSFIFLPNMDTPYYPPLGLPPPPVVPMYPAVPIPPVAIPPMLPIFAYKVTTATKKEEETTSTTTTAATATPDPPKQTTKHDETDISNTTDSPDDVESEAKNPETPADDNPDTNKLRHGIADTKNTPRIPRYRKKKIHAFGLRVKNLSPVARQKMLRQMKKMKGKSPNFLMPWKTAENFEPDLNRNTVLAPEIPISKYNKVPEELPINNINQGQIQTGDTLTDNVNFKYMSQLIHKEKINNTFDVPLIENTPNRFKDSTNVMDDLNTPFDAADLRRRIKELKNANKEEVYFTKLGQQIASLIRGLDTEKQKIKIEVEGVKPTYGPYLNYNSPRSFWERSVRSPLKLINSQKNKFEYLRKSNELLFNIENKVEILESTSRSFNLDEIENIVNMMEIAKRDIQNKENPINRVKSENLGRHLNVNLWPRDLHKTSFFTTPTSPIANDNKETVPNKDGIKIFSKHDGQQVLIWQNEAKLGKAHIDHIKNQNNQPITLNKPQFFHPQNTPIGENYFYNFPSRRSSNTFLPDHNNGLINLANQQKENQSMFLDRENKRRFFEKPSYFDREIDPYDFFK